MSTATKTGPGETAPARAAGPTTTGRGRMTALARAELTLLLRSKGTLFAALVVPLVLPFSFRSALDGVDLKGTGLSLGTVLLPTALGLSLVFAVYTSLTTIFVARREELVLKRLRTGEVRDHEILAGTAVPPLLIAVVQCVVLVAACMALLNTGSPAAAHLTVVGLLLGMVITTALAALTAALSRTAETAAVMSMPFLMISLAGSGMVMPLEVMPDKLAAVCQILPLTPVMTLIRGGWTGLLSGAETAGALAAALAWAAVAAFAVRRWFRWEPRH
ncbi:ABC transporter permease [Streptomyces tsukubensis]|uniref:Transport permease protein n=1 Tax=Streptomyces tsukubensis TaxID=83656 RepID=A0A1V4A5D8_9ACTN|nr:ABC transporter permease [Streptomyces tsukubensis]OON75608.1 hypothetical protein B1H18_22370 [Streptomyces tsukubensis]QFR94409.1 ABC transporter permease [Streptomyces tsukubensis]